MAKPLRVGMIAAIEAARSADPTTAARLLVKHLREAQSDEQHGLTARISPSDQTTASLHESRRVYERQSRSVLTTAQFRKIARANPHGRGPAVFLEDKRSA
jgi:hypothetical protein